VRLDRTNTTTQADPSSGGRRSGLFSETCQPRATAGSRRTPVAEPAAAGQETRRAEPAEADEEDQDDATGRVRAKPRAKTRVWTKVHGALAAVLPKRYHSKSTSKSERPYEAGTDFDDNPFGEDYQESCPRDTFGDHFANEEDRASTKVGGTIDN
jgi:hypothetical protein